MLTVIIYNNIVDFLIALFMSTFYLDFTLYLRIFERVTLHCGLFLIVLLYFVILLNANSDICILGYFQGFH